MNLIDIKEQLNFEDKFKKLSHRLRKNSMLSLFYDKMAADIEFDDLPAEVIASPYFKETTWTFECGRDGLLKKKARNVESCANYLYGDYYVFQGVKDIQKVNLCRDRFCDNCQNTLSVQRFQKYEPILTKFVEDGYLIDHVVLTVPNVLISELSSTLVKMYKAYKRLNIFLAGRKSVRNVNFSFYGYVGSIRALEITKNHETGRYHPHFHCLFMRRPGAKLKGRNINSYSFNKTEHRKGSQDSPYLFSDFEILLQKTWKLLFEEVEVNYSNIQELKIGYDVMLKNARGNYKEIFKYATKGLLSYDADKSAVSCYTDFVLLVVALYRKKLIQGYGCFYAMNFSDEIDTSSVDDAYLEVVRVLHEIENPVWFFDRRDEVEQEIKKKNITYVSRKSLATIGSDDYE